MSPGNPGNKNKHKTEQLSVTKSHANEGPTSQENISRRPVKFSSNKVFDGIEPPDNTIEICAYIDVAERAKVVGKERKYNLLKFVLNNNGGKRVQCIAWQDQVDRMKSIVEVNKILHLNGAVAKRVDNPAYNIGNVPYELIIREHTEVESKGMYEDIGNSLKSEPELAKWEDVAEMEGRLIKIDGWLKLNFNQTTHKTGDASYAIGAITNGEVKMAVRITSWTDLPKNLTKGCAITVVGILQYDGNNPYLKVARGTDIQEVEGPKMNEEELMEVSSVPRKKAKMG